jgi:DNA modification methylase
LRRRGPLTITGTNTSEVVATIRSRSKFMVIEGVKIPDEAVLLEIEKLNPYEKNARTHSQEQVEQIASSMLEFGFTNPILVDEKCGVIAGHGRLMAANHLGLKKVPVVVLNHLTENQKRAYILADNKLALNSGWDEGVLRKELLALDEAGYDLPLIGFSDEELNALMPDAEKCEEEPQDADAMPSIPTKPTSQLGDVWILGKHRLMVGDSTNLELVERMMDGVKADMIFTDPPYNVNYQGKTKDALKIQNDKMDADDFQQFLRDVFSTMAAVSKPGAAIYVCHAATETYNFQKGMMDAGFLVKQHIVWVKQSIVMGRQDYQWQHEPIFYGWLDGDSHTWYGDRKQSTVWSIDRPFRNEEHPTMKPIELVEKGILNSSERAQVVLDLFGGSGSTLITCEKNGRKCRTMELEPKYADVIVKRWQDFTKKKAVLEETGETFESSSIGRAKREA